MGGLTQCRTLTLVPLSRYGLLYHWTSCGSPGAALSQRALECLLHVHHPPEMPHPQSPPAFSDLGSCP